MVKQDDFKDAYGKKEKKETIDDAKDFFTKRNPEIWGGDEDLINEFLKDIDSKHKGIQRKVRKVTKRKNKEDSKDDSEND